MRIPEREEIERRDFANSESDLHFPSLQGENVPLLYGSPTT
jgi:hypothetical protein